MVQTTIKLRRGGGASSILFVVFGSMIALIALLSVYTNLFARFTKKKSAEHIDFMFTYKKATNSVMVEPILFTTAVEPFIVANLSAEPYTRTDPYWHITSNSSCPLHHMGLLLADDKFIDHQYMNLYCEVFRDFRISQQKTRMLEIGFGCGHDVHGISARIWKAFFTHGGTGVELYEVDLYSPQHKSCSITFLSEHPNVVSGLYLGDQSEKSFLRKVVKESGGSYDIVLDDGGHSDWHQRPTFAVLWDEVVSGGLYVIEDLQISSSREWMIRDILSWTDMLASTRYPSHPNWHNNPIDWVKWPWSDVPKGMISVHVQAEIAVFRKRMKYPIREFSLFWYGNRCELVRIDKKLRLGKFDNFNSYGDLYCETMRDFRRHRENRMPQMLLVGLSCNDRKNQSPENIAKLWKIYFNENNGTGVHIFGIDNEYNVTNECLNKSDPFMTGLYTRNMGIKKLNKTLATTQFVKTIHKGRHLDQQKFDVIIDDGKYSSENHHLYQKRSFFSLWPHVQLGGLYFIENMKASSSKNGMLRDVLGWMDHLLAPMQHANIENANWTVWHNELKCKQHTEASIQHSALCTTRPHDMLSIHCQADICVFRKAYELRDIKTMHGIK